MKITTRDELRRLVDELPENELDAAREALMRLMAEDRARSERRRRLLESGVFVSVPEEMTPEAYHAYEPVTVRGEPLSETVIKERR